MKNKNKYIEGYEKLRLLDPRTRGLEPEEGDTSHIGWEVKGVDVSQRQVTAFVSTPEVDRYEEIIEAGAFKKWLPHFSKNPVCLAGHDHSAFGTSSPTVIGKWSDAKITRAGLEATVTFATTKLAEEYWELYRDGYMRAFSVGFIGRSWEMREFDLGGVKKRIRVFTEVELLEISAVAVPANRGAIAKAAAFGCDRRAPDADSEDEFIERLIERLSDPDGKFARALHELDQRARDREGIDDYFEAPAEKGAAPASPPAPPDDGAEAMFV